MKFSESWLREWVNPEVNSDELAAQLTMLGLEVEGVVPAAAEFSGVVVGEVISLEKHPDADKLRICKVAVGDDEPLQIVCGAANVVIGMKAPCAKVGARLLGFKIKKAKLRGVPSMGMLCSEKELGLAESAEGLMSLPSDAPVGENIRDYLMLNDSVIEVDLTPNRGDCLSIRGVARDVCARNRLTLNDIEIAPVAAQIDDLLSVSLQAPERCPHYVGRVIRNIDMTAQTPLWMVERLRRSDIRAISPVVDVTNYVMLELGQPMHAFDLATLSGGIVVRLAEQGEKLILLDGNEVELDADSLVIADESQALALAGMMGGLASAVTDSSRDIFLESAFFVPEKIAGQPRRYGLHSDSAHRFERGVDPELQRAAMERATALLLEIVGGQAGSIIEAIEANAMPKKAVIVLRAARIKRVLGLDLAAEDVEEMLTCLGLQLEPVEGGWSIQPPSYRFDMNIEADLVEELARIYGYDRIPRTQPSLRPRMTLESERRVGLEQLQDTLVNRGYQEVVCYTFTDPELQALVEPDQTPLPLANPLSADLAVMRTTLFSGLLKTLQHNLNRQQSRVRLFESGLKFVQTETGLEQTRCLAGLISGTVMSEQWAESSRTVDFFDLKGDLEALFGRTAAEIEYRSEAHPTLHPGQSARLYKAGQPLGWMGALHPRLEKALGLSQGAFLFEIELEALLEGVLPKFQPLSRFPSIRRDLAIVVAESVSMAQVSACVHEVAPDYLIELRLFDLYRGKGIETGRKSLALGLILQELSRTLKEDEVEKSVAKILAHLQESLGATLRE